MIAFVLYFALAVAAAGCQASSPAPDSRTLEKPAQVTLSAAEVSNLRAKAEAGDAPAQFLLGQIYENGNGVPQNDESAAAWYRKAADQNNAAAQNRLGIMYRLGQGVKQDKAEAVRWYHKSAKLGNPQAMFNLGVSYYNGDGVPSDPDLAYAWFLLAQEAGNPLAKDAVRRSTEETGRLGTPDALQHIGAMYEQGDELPQSYSEAAKWYRKGADGSPKAAVRLASMLIEGKGVTQDYAQALALCEHAAKQRYSAGQYCVGYLSQRGMGTAKNLKQAAMWYEMAGGDGHRQAMMALAEMYWKGDGVSVNRPEAYYYFFRAYQMGTPESQTQAQKVWSEMNKNDMKQLQKKLKTLHFDPKKVFEFVQGQATNDPSR